LSKGPSRKFQPQIDRPISFIALSTRGLGSDGSGSPGNITEGQASDFVLFTSKPELASTWRLLASRFRTKSNPPKTIFANDRSSVFVVLNGPGDEATRAVLFPNICAVCSLSSPTRNLDSPSIAELSPQISPLRSSTTSTVSRSSKYLDVKCFPLIFASCGGAVLLLLASITSAWALGKVSTNMSMSTISTS
jgi:hypothetical protein